MRRLFIVIALACLTLQASAQQMISPNGRITANLNNGGLTVSFNQKQVLDIPVVGFEGMTTPQPFC